MDNEPPTGSATPSLLKKIMQFFGIGRPHDSTEELDQEIQELLDEGEEQGLISHHEGEMITSILEFRDTVTREIMTPRTQMACAPATASLLELIQLITEKGYTRIPIYGESPDHILGILHAKGLLGFCGSGLSQEKLLAIIRPAYFVLENQKIVHLLRYFQVQKIHLAIVTDEFGGVRGMVTLEDIIEEIVGEIVDESDKAENPIQIIDEDTVVADAQVPVEKIEDFFHATLPEGEYDSLGGLIIQQLGRLPETGTSLTLDDLVFEVLAADARRILSVKVSRKPAHA